MTVEFESWSPAAEGSVETEAAISDELMIYVLGCMPRQGDTVSIEQLAEDLDEAPATILEVLYELKFDKFLDFSIDTTIITVTYRDEEFLRAYAVYQSVR